MAKTISSNELNGADPVETPESVKDLVGEVASPTKGRKAKLSGETAMTTEKVMPDFAALGLEGEALQKAEEIYRQHLELGRKSTDTVFQWGLLTVGLQDMATSQEHFVKLAKGVLDLSRRGAENYAKVYARLQPHRDRLVKAGIVASALYDLASVEAEKVEEVLAAREAGQRLTHKQIKAMIGMAETSSVSPDDGGPAGLKARIAEKTATGVPAAMQTAFDLLVALLSALEPHRRGKSLVVKDIQRQFIFPSRLLRQQLEWLTFVADRAPEGSYEFAIHSNPIVKGDRWADLGSTLYQLGSLDGWPKKPEVAPWLCEKVVPQLEWLLGERAQKAHAVVEKLDAAAEAERQSAADAKRLAKAAAKKAGAQDAVENAS